jgi:hypothetical protein
MTLNLLPWRESKAWCRLKNDALIFCLALGCIALLLEAGLESMGGYVFYLAYENTRHTQKIKHSAQLYQQAILQYQQLDKIKTTINQQINLQQQWLKVWQQVNIMAELTPHDILWKKMVWQEQAWTLQGTTLLTEKVNAYQKRLQAQHYDAELIDWQPDMTQKLNNSFTLKVHFVA